MADVTRVILHNIVSVTQGLSTYKGVRSFSFNINKGRLMPILPEGVLYPTGAENVGAPDFPVTTSLVVDSGLIASPLLVAAVGNLVIVYQSAQGAGNKTLTIANHQFSSDSQQQALQQAGPVTAQGVAFSTDGNSLPIAYG